MVDLDFISDLKKRKKKEAKLNKYDNNNKSLNFS